MCTQLLNKGIGMDTRITGLMAALMCVLALGGCVTINIYFPAAAAEKAADKIIDEVWQIKKGGDAAKIEKPAAAQ
jgi:hypothetical protein